VPVHDWTRVDAGIFHDFHVAWISELRKALNSGLLPPDYYALAEPVAGDVAPDVLTLQTPAIGGNGAAGSPTGGEGGVATMAPPKVELTYRFEPDPYSPRRRTVAIRHRSGHEVVALIEIVSHGNKASQHAIDTFLDKAVRAIHHGIHLLIIDLHPRTPRDPGGLHAALWERLTGLVIDPPPKSLTLAAYKSSPPWEAYVQPLAVGEALTDMPLYLTPDTYVTVPLEQTYQLAYGPTARFYRDVLEA
jgi:hypothetical protein